MIYQIGGLKYLAFPGAFSFSVALLGSTSGAHHDQTWTNSRLHTCTIISRKNVQCVPWEQSTQSVQSLRICDVLSMAVTKFEKSRKASPKASDVGKPDSNNFRMLPLVVLKNGRFHSAICQGLIRVSPAKQMAVIFSASTGRCQGYPMGLEENQPGGAGEPIQTTRNGKR